MDQSGLTEYQLNSSIKAEDAVPESFAILEQITAYFFLVIFFFSITGNGLMLVVLCRYENWRRVTNLFILNLLTSDLLFTLTLPFWALYHLQHWLFGEMACKLMTGLYFTGFYSSIMLLTCLTLDRFMTVVVPSWNAAPKRRLRFAWSACVASWVISLAASLCEITSTQVQEVDNGTFTCEASTVSEEEEILGYYLQVSLLFVLPLTIIICSYSAILRKVLVTATRRPHRTILAVFFIVLAFFICWTPYNLVLFLQTVHPSVVDSDYRRWLDVSYVTTPLLSAELLGKTGR
ncbi:hypothetical protein DPEC_G00053570 [Dallia pectoralis]|uniref:Uncharacterized protein n=1 Tax=Dallia pectoralis TaxID=75939 RepID=A0ACC2H4V1_DALPE|nr:hypothetical protein DPEC_G00053570 [Dallia pectoralis]